MDFITKVIMKRANEKKWVKKVDNFNSGDTVNVFVRIKEGEKERVQVYKGVVIKIQGNGMGKSFTVRKISSGIGVERTFPFMSPNLDRVEVVSHGRVRRSRLYFLRDLSGRAARLTSDLVVTEGAVDSTGATDGAAATPKAAKKSKKTEATKTK
ncbi:MAG: 50S ribosomal protein L19 [Bdellovibrionales bacterium]